MLARNQPVMYYIRIGVDGAAGASVGINILFDVSASGLVGVEGGLLLARFSRSCNALSI